MTELVIYTMSELPPILNKAQIQSTVDHICEIIWSLEGKLLKRKEANAVTVQYEGCRLTFDMTNE